MEPLALYIHIPFCATKCPYCDFNTYAGIESLIPSYSAALSRELEIWGALLDTPKVTTVFFGGGTPSYIGIEHISEIFSSFENFYNVQKDAEITLEINPDDVTYPFALALNDLGFNRVSIGVQSLDDNLLTMLGRRHNADQAETAYTQLRSAGFNNISLDLMYGLPNQSLQQWSATLDKVLHMAPEHISLYCLTLEQGTPMEYQVRVGKLARPDDDLAADMYQLAESKLAEQGYTQYEISNWTQPNRSSTHNLVYWKNGSYIGVGPGAHSSLHNHRFSNLNSPRQYINKLKSTKISNYQPWQKLTEEKLRNLPFIDDVEALEKGIQMGETMMLGLRLNEGIHLDSFNQRFGQDLRHVYTEELEDLTNLGLLHYDEESLKLTDKGRLLGNEVFARFL